MATLTEEELRTKFPWVPWDDPILITVPGVGEGFGCRFCIAQYGLRGADVAGTPQSAEEFDNHMTLIHGGST